MKRIIWWLTFLALWGLIIFCLWESGRSWSLVRQQKPSLITPIPPKEVLKFSVIGDPESDLGNLKKALDFSESNQVKFTVLVGDLTSVGSLEELRQVKGVLDESGVKYYAIPGNHDLYSSRKLAKDPTRYFEEVFGDAYQLVYIPIPSESGKVSGLDLLLLNNGDDNLGVDNKQIGFIRTVLGSKSTELDSAVANLNLVFLHKPLYHPTSEYIMGYENEEVSKQKDELLKMFKESSVSAVFSGHLHNTNFYEKDNLKMFVAGSINSSRNWQTPRFLEVKVLENGELTVKEIEPKFKF